MKQVYIAKYKRGLMGPTKVLGEDIESAKKAAYATWAYHAMMTNPLPQLKDVVESVELDSSASISGNCILPTVQVDIEPVKARDILKQMFAKEEPATEAVTEPATV